MVSSTAWITVRLSVDDEIYADGSANLTGQSQKNLESVLVTRVRTVLETARRVFADAWEEATEVSYERLLVLPEHAERRSASASAKRYLRNRSAV